MESFDKYLYLQERLAKQMEIFYRSPIMDIMEQQQQTDSNLRRAAQTSFLPSESTNTNDLLTSAAHTPMREWADMYSKISSFIQKMLISPINESASSFAIAFQEPSALSTYLANFLPENLQQYERLGTLSDEQFKSAFEPFISSINAIRVYPESVELPKKLIPEQIVSGIEIKSESDALTDILPHSTAKYLIHNILIPVFVGVLSGVLSSLLIQRLFSSGQTQYQEEHMDKLDRIIQQNDGRNRIELEQNELLKESNQLQKEENELLKAQTEVHGTVISFSPEDAEKIMYAIDYLLSVSEQLETSDYTPNDSDNSPAKIQPLSPETEDLAQNASSSVLTESSVSQPDDLIPSTPPSPSDSSEH